MNYGCTKLNLEVTKLRGVVCDKFLVAATGGWNWVQMILPSFGAVFAGRFKKLVGETPLTYLTDWRMSMAREILKVETITIDEVAAKVGCQSEPAFNRIFKAKTGKTPALYRRLLEQV